MTSTEPPVRPDPYISEGNGWTLSVRVPGHGTWRHDGGQVSSYAVYNQAGRAYHVTIDHAYIRRPESPTPERNLNAHVTSNAAVGGRVLHWPDPGVLSVAQRNWMDEHNGAGQFDALLAAFQARIRLCATNVKLSRDYDKALDEYQRRRHEAAAARRVAKAEYAEELKEWVDARLPEEYQQGFTNKGEWYFLDSDRGVVARLDPRPIMVRQGDGLHTGFVNLCESIVAPPGVPLTAEHWSRLTAALALVRIADRHYAMRRSELDACPAATELLSADQVVELAVAAWTGAAQTSQPYTRVVSDRTVMNLNGPGSAEFHLELKNLLDMVGLTREGTGQAAKLAVELDPLPDLPGVYPTTCVAQLQAKLPRIARITRQSQSDGYLLHDQLVSGWSADLAKADSVDAGELARSLVSKGACRQVFVADLVVLDEEGSAVYLRDGDQGPARYVGRKEDALPGARLSPAGVVTNLAAQAGSLRTYFGGGLAKTVVARDQTGVVVICDYNRRPLTPLIFVDERSLTEFDPDAAAKQFVERQREIQEAKKREAAKTEAAISEAVDEYTAAWNLIEPQLASARATLLLYGAEGRVVAAKPGSDAAIAAELSQARLLDQIWIEKTDRPTNSGKIRRLDIAFANKGLRGWVEQLAEHIKKNKPGLPNGFRGYLVTLPK